MEIFLFFLFATVIISVVVHRYKVKRQKQLQKQGVVNIIRLKHLISNVQVHRGLSSSWLNGDDSKLKQLVSIDQKNHTEIQNFQKNDALSKNARWLSFCDHWPELTIQQAEREPENNFKQHTLLISNLLYLLEDEAERSHLNSFYLQRFKNVGIIWRELVVTTESIGQSRAIGVGVATSKKCSSVDKIRLSFLLQNIDKTMNEILPKLSSLGFSKGKHSGLLNEAKTKMEDLTQTIRCELLEASEITLDQNRYFSLATASMLALDNIFEHQVKQIEQAL